MNNQNLKSKNNVRVVKNGKKKIIIKRKVPKNKNFKIKLQGKEKLKFLGKKQYIMFHRQLTFLLRKYQFNQDCLNHSHGCQKNAQIGNTIDLNT